MKDFQSNKIHCLTAIYPTSRISVFRRLETSKFSSTSQEVYLLNPTRRVTAESHAKGNIRGK
jgi:hypothetical protein